MDMINTLFEEIAHKALRQIIQNDEGLKPLYVQPDRAIYLASSSKIILKVYSETELLQKEFDMYSLAQSIGVPTPYVYELVKSNPSVLVLEALDGIPITSEHKEAAYEAGKYLEKFHKLSANPPFSNGQMTWDSFVLTWARKELDELKNLKVFSESEVNNILKYFNNFKEILKERPIRLLHGDLQPAHILIREDKVTGIIDFADTQPGDPLMDIAVLTLWDTNLAELIISGYSSIRFEELTIKLLDLYRLLRKIGEVPWLLKRGFTEKANRNITDIKEKQKELL